MCSGCKRVIPYLDKWTTRCRAIYVQEVSLIFVKILIAGFLFILNDFVLIHIDIHFSKRLYT